MVLAQRSRRTAVILAWLGVIFPGLHKFYLGQPVWGCFYLLLGFSPWAKVPRVSCALEAVLLQSQSEEAVDGRWGKVLKPNPGSPSIASIDLTQINTLGAALRELDTLRQDGLISELEFEQKRRLLLDQVA
jgi:TM2 domain-containing membrane protein YozV